MSRHDHSHHSHHDDGSLAELLDLDAEIVVPAMRAVHHDIERCTDAPVRTILDLGAGTGTGTFGLLEHFSTATAIAVDASDVMLSRLEAQAGERGLAGRVAVRQADLDDAVPPVGPVDLVWASASLHHLADPDRTLAQIVDQIRPDGLMVVAELDGLARFLPDGTEGAHAEDAAHALLSADRATDLPTMGSDWGVRLNRAGLIVELHRAITVEVPQQSPPIVGRYAAAMLTRLRGSVADRLATGDLDALDALLGGGPGDIRHRTDLQVMGGRWLWIARRPA